jgi:hypothetical protein
MKRKKYNAAKEVKAIARERIGRPKPARVLDEKPALRRKPKHKKPVLESEPEG